MIIIITHAKCNKTTGRMERIVSHGIDLETSRAVILPSERPEYLGAVFDPGAGEYIIRDKTAGLTSPSKARPR